MTMTAPTRGRRAPGPRGSLLWGSLGEFRHDPLGLLVRATARYGDLVRLRFGPVVAHLANHPALIERILIDASHNYDKRTRSVAKMRATCGSSLLTSDGPAWLRQRRLAQPSFQASRLDAFVPTMASTVDQWFQSWDDAARRGQPLDLAAEMMHLTVTIAARVFFGVDVAADARAIEESLAAVLADTWRRLENLVDLSAMSPALHRRGFRAALARLEAVVERAIAARRSGGCVGAAARNGGPTEDLLAALLRARDEQTGASLNDQELRDAVLTLLLAGHETTASALSWTIYLLLGRPDASEQLRAEVDQALGAGLPDAASLGSLEFAGRAFAEGVRLYPSIWIMERRVVAEDWLAGYRIPAGSTLLISPYALHRHREFWPDAERFDPERFTATAAAARPRLAYLPFGAGGHVCIGREMAQLVARLVLAMTWQRFRLELIEGQTAAAKGGITLRHARPVWIRVQHAH